MIDTRAGRFATPTSCRGRSIVAAKRDKPHWGARKIRELLVRRLDDDISESLLVVNFAIGDRYWMADGAQNPCTPIHGNANSPGFG